MRIGTGMTISWKIRDMLGDSNPSCVYDVEPFGNREGRLVAFVPPMNV